MTVEANHVIAAVSLLRRSRTSRARCGVKFQILQRCLVLLGEFTSIGFWCTDRELAMPALETSAAECERAVLTNSEEVSPRNKLAGTTHFSI
jgi:hypothetical protein